MSAIRWILACLAITALCGRDGLADEQRWAVIFAPDPSGLIAASPSHRSGSLHRSGAALMKARLLQAGFAAGRIHMLTGETDQPGSQATRANLIDVLKTIASRIGRDDVLLVSVHAAGLHLNGADWLVTSTTSSDQLQSLQRTKPAVDNESLLSLQQIVSLMSTAVTPRQCLLIDGVADDLPVDRSLTQGFGTENLRVHDDQCVVINRSAARRRDLTLFTKAVADGLVEYADGDQDGLVSRFELLEHIQRCAQAAGISAPVIKGELSFDFSLAVASGLGDEDGFTQTERDRLASLLLRSARTEFLVEHNDPAAQEHLQRAARYRPSREIREEIIGLLLSVLASRSGFDKAWTEAEAQGRPLLYLAKTPLVMKAEDRILGTIPPGELVLITDRQGRWAHPKQRFAVSFEKDEIRFQPVATPNGWLWTEPMKPVAPDSGESITALTAALRKLNGQSLPAADPANRQIGFTR